MTPAPKRRWSFSLRTLFVVVTASAVSVWLGWPALDRWLHREPENPLEQLLNQTFFIKCDFPDD